MFRAARRRGSSSRTRSISTPTRRAPLPATQVVVRAEVVEYLGQVTWSFGRIAEAPAARR